MILHQVVALEDSKKKKRDETLTLAYKIVQSVGLFAGLHRSYASKDDEGEQLPSESQKVQQAVPDIVEATLPAVEDYWTLIRTRDDANCKAVADVIIGSATLLKVPLSHLLFLEKQITDIITFINHWPTLDPAEKWTKEGDMYVSDPKETTRTKKVPKAFVKAEATERHPAQVETFHEDILVGYWKTIKLSGAVSIVDKQAALERAQKVKDAIIKARQLANTIEVQPNTDDVQLLNYIFG